MTEPLLETTCSDCGVAIDTTKDEENLRAPCSNCGSNKRTYDANITESIVIRDGIGVKAKRPGEKRPFIEEVSKPDFSRNLQKFVHLRRVINRDNDQYYEKVTEYETGEVIHHCEEPLSEHQGHGNAKNKSK